MAKQKIARFVLMDHTDLMSLYRGLRWHFGVRGPRGTLAHDLEEDSKQSIAFLKEHFTKNPPQRKDADAYEVRALLMTDSEMRLIAARKKARMQREDDRRMKRMAGQKRIRFKK